MKANETRGGSLSEAISTEEQQQRKTLREWRERRGFSQKGMARIAHLNNTTIFGLEKGAIPLDSESAQKVMAFLEVTPEQVLPCSYEVDIDPGMWPNDGLIPEAPHQPLKWWRERRGLTQTELCVYAGVSLNTVKDIEQATWKNVRPATRRKLARALKVAPDKIIFPGQNVRPSSEREPEDVLRAELRGARRALRKAYDFLRDDPNIALKALDKRDAIMGDIERELRGT